MARETYKGRKITTKIRRTAVGRELVATVNGKPASWIYAHDGAEAKMLDSVRRQIDFIDEKPIDGASWGIEWYDPKTVELCPEGLHPQAIGGRCTHPTC